MCNLTTHQLSPEAAARFAFSSVTGSTTFTVVSPATGQRFTYKVDAKTEPCGDETVQTGLFFVSLLTGSNNEADYQYIGIITTDALGVRRFKTTRATRVSDDAASVRALTWCVNRLDAVARETRPDLGFEMWHEGRCGRCGRKLTVPASIESGFGPVCINLN